MTELLITGGTGMVGKAIQNLLPEDYDVSVVGSKPYNLLDPAKARKMIREIKPKKRIIDILGVWIDAGAQQRDNILYIILVGRHKQICIDQYILIEEIGQIFFICFDSTNLERIVFKIIGTIQPLSPITFMAPMTILI